MVAIGTVCRLVPQNAFQDELRKRLGLEVELEMGLHGNGALNKVCLAELLRKLGSKLVRLLALDLECGDLGKKQTNVSAADNRRDVQK